MGKSISAMPNTLWGIVRVRVLTAVVAVLSVVLGISVVQAPTPANALSAGVAFSADDQPTWQTNGTVWAIGAAQGKVVAGGTFSQVLPPTGQPGTALSQSALVILDAETGAPDSCQFPMALSGGTPTVRAVTSNADGSIVYIGGNFSNVGGVNVARIAALDVSACRVLPFRAPLPGSTVTALEVRGNTLYAGGLFNSVGSAVRRAFAAFNATSGGLLEWTADAVRTRTDLPASVLQGRAIAVSQSGDKVAIGGDFFEVNGAYSHSIAIVSPATGPSGAGGAVLRTYPAGFIPDTSVTKDIIDGGDGKFYIGNEGSGGGVFDGRAAFSWETGDQVWRDNCLGATQALLMHAGTLYSASHAHDCSSINAFGDGIRRYFNAQNPETTEIYGWLPLANDGIGEGIGPRALVVATGKTTGKSFLWSGGEFTRINGKVQQSLTRFSPDDVGAPPVPVVSAEPTSDGTIQVRFRTVVDPDDSDLTYRVYRNNGTTPVWTGTAKSLWWERPQVSFSDANVTAGTNYTYRVTASDGTNTSSLSAAVSARAITEKADYDAAVRSLTPLAYWSGTANGSWVIDESAAAQRSDGQAAILMDGASATVTESAVDSNTGSYSFDGINDYFLTDQYRPGPSTYTVSAWIKTTTTSGGKIVGFGNGRPITGTNASVQSGSYDRHLYMLNDGRVRFGVYTGGAVTLTSQAALNDGQWHYVVGTQAADGMKFYVDGTRVGSNSVSAQQSYWGIWRVGGDSLGGWPDQPSSSFFNGLIDEVAVYSTALARTTVAKQYILGGGTSTIAPEPTDAYGAAVYGADPELFWRLSDTDSTAADASVFGANPGVYNSGAVNGQPGVLVGNTAARTGGESGTIATQQQLTPSGTMTAEVWFKTTTNEGGKILGFENTQTGNGNSYDKHLYMNNDGYLVWGSYPGYTATVSSAERYNDGVWHQAVGVLDSSGRKLYVDGTLVAENGQVGAETGAGYWRLGGGSIGGWPTQPSSFYFDGVVDEFSVYNAALTSATISEHYSLGASAAASPSAPTTVTARVVPSGVDVSWSASEGPLGVVGYRVYRGVTADFEVGPATLLKTTANRSTVDTTAPVGVAFYRIVAVGPVGMASSASSFSEIDVPDTAAPATPGGVTASVNASEVSLAWTASADDVGVVSYDVHRGSTPDFTATIFNKIGSSGATTYLDAPRPAGTSYYRVVAIDAAGNSSPQSGAVGAVTPDTSAPTTPASLQAQVGGDPEITLTWSASVDNVEVVRYDVYRGTATDFAINESSKITHRADRAYTDVALAPGTWYYRVLAVDQAGNASLPSDVVSGTIADTTAPSIPSDPLAVANGADVAVTWDPSVDDVAVARYEVHRGESAGFVVSGATRIGETATESFIDAARPAGASFYRVVAIDAADNASAASVSAAVTVSDLIAPSAPVAAATLEGDTATVSWPASTDNVGVTGYRIFRGPTADFVSSAETEVAEVSVLNYVSDELAVGSWFYRVSAIDSAGNLSADSNTVSVTVADTAAPTAPGDLSNTVAGLVVNLTWNAATDNVGVAGYEVHRSSTANFTVSVASRVATTAGTSYSDASATADTWYYRVVALDAAGNASTPSSSSKAVVVEPDTIAPSAPGAVTAAAVETDVTLGWTAATDNAGIADYVIYRGATADFATGPDTLIATVTDTTYLDEGLSAGSWFYRVTAVDTSGNVGPLSQVASATVADASGPTAPPSVAATVDGDQVSVSWDPSVDDVGVVGYRVHRGQTAGFSVSSSNEVVQVATTLYIDVNRPAGPWYYKVVAVDGAGNTSAASEPAEAIVLDAVAPSTVTNVVSTPSFNGVVISWEPATDNVAVVGYQVHRGSNASFVVSAANKVSDTTAVGYTDSVGAGTWFYKVVSLDAAGNFGQSSTAAQAVVADVSAPTVPVGVAAVVAGANVTVSWSASTDDVGVSGYAVYRGSSAEFEVSAGSKVGDVASASFVDSSRPVGAWFYKVAAVDAAGNASAASAAVSATISGAVNPVSVTLDVVDDAMVLGALPTQNNGALNQLSSRGGSSPLLSFLSFALPAAPAGTVLTGAELRVRTSTDVSANSADTHSINIVSGAWTELGVNWNNRPSIVGALVGTLGATPAINTPYAVNLSPSALTGALGTTQTLRLSSTGSDNVRLWSSESTAVSYRPVLVLTFTPVG